jgi:cell wall-associated NlpC family hydrolase
VNWRAFCVNGVIYFISDEDLFLSKPFMVISEDSDGIDTIDYDFDEGKRRATLNITAHLTRWSAPPGSTITVKDMGTIADGKWLVDTIERSLFDHIATITAIKPQPVLPEPSSNSTSKVLSGTANAIDPTPAFPAAALGQGETSGPVQTKIVNYVRQQLGVPYRWGAEVPGVAFDCSGLAQAAYSAAGISIPRVAQDQYDAGAPILPPAILLPGDLVFFGDDLQHIDHVGIYIGAGQMIDAPHTGANVRIDNGFTGWTNPTYLGGARLWQL